MHREQQDDKRAEHLEHPESQHVDPRLGVIDSGRMHGHVKQFARCAVDGVGEGLVHDAQNRGDVEHRRGQKGR